MFAMRLRLSLRPGLCRGLTGAAVSANSSQTAASKVAFVGMGNMGAPMALALLRAGHIVFAYDVRAGGAWEAAVRAAGGTVATSAGDAASGADAVVTMLPSTPAVREVYESAGGVFERARAGALLLDCSTIDPRASAALAAAAAARSLRMVDAPVSGGVNGAADATLTFMVGGAAQDFEAARELLRGMGRAVVHCGGPGGGQIAKLVNNYVLGASMAAVAEALNMGVKLGADPKVLSSVINTSSGRCWSSEVYNPVPGVMPGVPAARGYAGGFAVPLMVKDLGLAADAARSVGAPAATGAAALATYTTMHSHGDVRDFSAIYDFVAGRPVPR